MNLSVFSFRKFCFLLLLSLFTDSMQGFAQSLGGAGAFMRVGIGARAGSLGNAYVAAAHGPEAIYWNPAALAVSPSWEVAVTQRRHSFGRNFTFAGTTIPLTSNQALGLSWTGFRTGGIEARQGNTADPDAYFSDEENAFALAWGYHLNSWLSLGSSVKLVHQNLFTASAFGYSGTLGLLIEPTPILSFGAHWQDFVSSFRWSTGSRERFPRVFMLGMALQFMPHSLMTIDYHSSASQNAAQETNGAFRVGAEYRPTHALPFRIGYSRNAFNLGLGFEIPVAASRAKVDYNFSIQDGLNENGHVLSLAFEFDRSKKNPSRDNDSDFAARFEQSAKREARLANESAARRSTSTPDSVFASGSDSPAAALKDRENLGKTYIAATVERAIVRHGPGTSFRAMGVLRAEAKYEVLSKRGEWVEIKCAGKRSGWIQAEKVKIMAAEARRLP